MTEIYDLIVIGAGPAGLMASGLLRKVASLTCWIGS